jgi:hypothetical protein
VNTAESREMENDQITVRVRALQNEKEGMIGIPEGTLV